jgi:hypothetical protein
MDGMHRVARALVDDRRAIKARRLRELPEIEVAAGGWCAEFGFRSLAGGQ